MERRISLPAWIFAGFLLLFPIDSALGTLSGPSVNNDIAVLCMAVTVLFYADRVRFTRNLMTDVYIGYILFQTVSIVYGGALFSDRNLLFLFYSVMALLLAHYSWSTAEKRLIGAAILGGVLLAVALTADQVDFSGSGRLFLSLNRRMDPNYLCANLIFGTVLIARLLFSVRSRMSRLLLRLLLAAEFGCILAFGSRGGLLGNLAAALTVFWVHRRARPAAYWAAWAAALIGAAVWLRCAGLLPAWLTDRFDPVRMIQDGGAGRLTIWADYLRHYGGGSPGQLLFGYGRGAIYVPECGSAHCTHSIYLKALIEGGMVGALLQLLLIVASFDRIRRSGNSELYALLIGYCICGLFLDLDDYRIFPLLMLLLSVFGQPSGKRMNEEENGICYCAGL